MSGNSSQTEPDGSWEDVGQYETADEEAAQLLPTEEFDFQDSDGTTPRANATQHPSRQRRRPARLASWLSGPHTPQIQKVTPLLPSIQQAPISFVDALCPTRTRRGVFFGIILFGWASLFWGLLWIAARPIHDGAGNAVLNLDCVDTLWSRKNLCGVDGMDCRPFANASFAFRCPTNCASVQVLNPHAVGPLDVNYRPLVVGNNPYRGDSFICGSAIHAGLVTDARGGCGRVERVGQHEDYASAAKNGIESIPFDSYFPLSFTVSADPSFSCDGGRVPGQLLVVSLVTTIIASVFTTSAAWQFASVFTVIFIHVAFVSDPPQASYLNTSVLPDHISLFAARYLPAAFCAVIIYWVCVRRTLEGLTAQLEKTILWLGGFWFGALSNFTFGWLPIQRLTAHDLEQQPGAKAALAGVLIVLVLIVAQQIYYFWLEGRLPRHLMLYGLFLAAIFVGLVIPGVELRLHHYIIALLLLPGTSMQTRPSLLYQGILLGLFVNGIARWGFDSVLQTASALRGDGTFDSLLPSFAEPVVSSLVTGSTISFAWSEKHGPAVFDAISALVNDVERYRHFFADSDMGEHNFTWYRPGELAMPEYFRFAYVKSGVALDYTMAGTWFANGTWKPGPDGS